MTISKQNIAILVAVVLIIAVGVLFFVQGDKPGLNGVNKTDLLAFFEENIHEIVPGDEAVSITRARFAGEGANVDMGVYIEYTDDQGQNPRAFLVLLNEDKGITDYEIVGVFSMSQEGKYELIGGADTFRDQPQEIYDFNSETGEWSITNGK